MHAAKFPVSDNISVISYYDTAVIILLINLLLRQSNILIFKNSINWVIERTIQQNTRNNKQNDIYINCESRSWQHKCAYFGQLALCVFHNDRYLERLLSYVHKRHITCKAIKPQALVRLCNHWKLIQSCLELTLTEIQSK